MATKKIGLKKNDRVVYPPHGPVTVVGIKSEEVFGEKRQYLIMQAEDSDLTLKAPLDRLDEIGVRPPMPKTVAKEVLKILSEPATAQSAQWSRRFKAHNEKLHSGDPIQIAELIRNLELADAKKPVSAGEKRLLKAARHSLEGELAITWASDRETASVRIDKSLADNPEMVKTLEDKKKEEDKKKKGTAAPATVADET
ncbi:MAG: CarD family transcriptional regulator [Acidimicrobiia bacterium]